MNHLKLIIKLMKTKFLYMIRNIKMECKSKSTEKSKYKNKNIMMKITTQINYLKILAMKTMMIKMIINNTLMSMMMNKIQTRFVQENQMESLLAKKESFKRMITPLIILMTTIKGSMIKDKKNDIIIHLTFIIFKFI